MAIKTNISKHHKAPAHTIAIAVLALITLLVGVFGELFLLYSIW